MYKNKKNFYIFQIFTNFSSLNGYNKDKRRLKKRKGGKKG